MNENAGLWLLCMGVCAAIFVARSVMAWRGGEPARLLSFMEVKPEEIIDVPACNRANGIMWLCYSAVFWVSALLGILNLSIAGPVLAAGCLGGIPVLVIAYSKICKKYKITK